MTTTVRSADSDNFKYILKAICNTGGFFMGWNGKKRCDLRKMSF